MSVRLTRQRLSVAAAMRSLEGPGLGGVAVFVGRVRPDARRGATVVALDYEAHRPIALAVLDHLERTVRRRFRAGRIVLWHRLGSVPVGEVSVVVGVAAAHRTEAFGGARFLIEQVKTAVPIWKAERARPARRRRRRPAGPVGR